MGEFLITTLVMVWTYIAEFIAYVIILVAILAAMLIGSGITSLWRHLFQWYIGRDGGPPRDSEGEVPPRIMKEIDRMGREADQTAEESSRI